MEESLRRLVVAENPWIVGGPLDSWCARRLPEHFIPRMAKPEPGDRAALVVGPRQAGKSSMIWKLLSQTGRPFLYVNCEEPAIRHWLASPALFLQDLQSLARDPFPLFFDEVQRLSNAGIFIKGLVDHKSGLPIYATGSSSFDLESETRESLAGRATRHLLLPFSTAELAGDTAGPETPAELRLAKLIERHLVFGAYPSVVRADSPEHELATLVEAFVIRDASDRFKIRNAAAFRKVLELAASQAGNLANFSEWASLAGISGDTVSEYVRLLEETHIVRLVRPFIGGKRAEITSAPKVYFVDNGVRNLLFGGFAPPRGRPDQGALWENYIFSEMLKYTNPLLDSIRYWRSKGGAEVDFVVESRGLRVPVEVKAGDARGGLTRSARSFIDAYAPPLFLVVNSRKYAPQQSGRTEIRFLRPVDFFNSFREIISATAGAAPRGA